MRNLSWRLGWMLGVSVLSFGCTTDENDAMDSGSSGDATESGSGTGSDDDPSASSSPPDTSASGSQSGTGTTTVGGTDDEGTTTNGGSSSDATATDSTTSATDKCAGLGRKECNANPECEPIVCSPFVPMDIGVVPWCMGEPGFIGCQEAGTECAEERTTTCEGDDAPTYVCPTACIPDGWLECAPPVDGQIPMCEG